MKRFSRDIFKRDVLPWFFLVPAIISFALFKYYPILLGFFVSFFEVNIVDLPGRSSALTTTSAPSRTRIFSTPSSTPSSSCAFRC